MGGFRTEIVVYGAGSWSAHTNHPLENDDVDTQRQKRETERHREAQRGTAREPLADESGKDRSTTAAVPTPVNNSLCLAPSVDQETHSIKRRIYRSRCAVGTRVRA